MIPGFNLSGVLPPYTGASPTDPAGLSPYDTCMSEIAVSLCKSAERAAILRGFIEFREQLRSLGISVGYQWCAGSFCEDIEVLEKRSPGDIDVVTFFVRPEHVQGQGDWERFVARNVALFDANQTRETYRCDAYFVDAGLAVPTVISQVTYWHGLFGHRRSSHLWKGMLRVPLTSDDAGALAHINEVWP